MQVTYNAHHSKYSAAKELNVSEQVVLFTKQDL